MSRSQGLLLAAMVSLVGSLVGCNVVPRPQYEDLHRQYNELSNQHDDLTLQLEDAKANESRLLAEVAQAKQRAAAAEAEATRLRSAQGPQPAPSPGVAPPRAEVSLVSDMLFDAGKAALNAQGKRRVADVAAEIRRRYPGAKIRVYGHTDSTPIRASNWDDNLELSAQRAMAVTRELIAAGVPAEDIETIGVGATQPVASNQTAAGRARNRRVVIKVLH